MAGSSPSCRNLGAVLGRPLGYIIFSLMALIGDPIYGPALCVPSPPPPPPKGIPPPTPPMICFKSANSHRDQPRQGRHPRNCRRFWSRKASILVTVVTFGQSCCRRASKVPTVTGIGVVLIAILRTVLTFDPSCCRRASDVSTD